MSIFYNEKISFFLRHVERSDNILIVELLEYVREPFKNYLADFVPYPLNGQSFFQKTLSGKGGYTLEL